MKHLPWTTFFFEVRGGMTGSEVLWAIYICSIEFFLLFSATLLQTSLLVDTYTSLFFIIC